MADNIELVINISEEAYMAFKSGDGIDWLGPILSAVANGKPIPKEHGRLKDIDAFIAKVNADRKHACYVRSWTADDVLEALDKNYAPTIIEAKSEDNV